MLNRLIILFTDFGRRDSYVAQMVGVIVSINPAVRLLDLNHEVDPFNITGAAYTLEASVRFFPAGTIVVSVVDPGVGSARRSLLLHTQADHWFVGPDNGIFTKVVEQEGLLNAYELAAPRYYRDPHVSATFHGRDIFAPVAAHLSLGVEPSQFGPRVTDIMALEVDRPYWSQHTLIGMVRDIDHFGNVITTITRNELGDMEVGQQMRCCLGAAIHAVPFVNTYAESAPGELVCLMNSGAELELAVNQGHAADRIGAEIGALLRVTFGE